MNKSLKNAKYLRATKLIRFGFGVSGSDSVPKGCVGKIINKNDWPASMLVDLVGIGIRGMTIIDVETITEKEYFKGLLKGE